MTTAELEAQFANWKPTSENINALPGPLREYIHRLEANTDPSGELQRAMVAEMKLAALLMNTWRSIDSAPKDGTRILIYCGANPWSHHGCSISLASWDYNTWVGDFAEEVYAGEAPTHWMPLPDTPDLEGGHERG